MTEIRVKDDGGAEMELFEFNGFRYPNFPFRVLPTLHLFQFVPDDILICAYPKSGTHWVWEITRLLLAGELDDSPIIKGVGMLEVATDEMQKELSSPRVLNTHLLYRNLPKSLGDIKPKIIYITRNPKDVMVSFYNFNKNLPNIYHYYGEWKDYLKPAALGKFDYGSWFDYTKEWEAVVSANPDLPVFKLNFEDLKEDTMREVKKLTEFLGVSRSDEFIQEVCDRCDFNTLRKIKHTFSQGYRKGVVGDWKNWFTVAQNDWFDQVYKEKMADCPLKFRYALDES